VTDGPTAILGSLARLLDDPAVVEISANPDGRVFVQRFGAAPEEWGVLEPDRAERFIRWCASRTGGLVTRERPILSGRIPGTAHRVEATVPPVTEGPCISIRRHVERVPSLADCVPDPAPRRILVEALESRKNVLIAGATGAGKTTLLNACLGELARIAPDTRLVTIEDTPEIRAPFRNFGNGYIVEFGTAGFASVWQSMLYLPRSKCSFVYLSRVLSLTCLDLRN